MSRRKKTVKTIGHDVWIEHVLPIVRRLAVLLVVSDVASGLGHLGDAEVIVGIFYSSCDD